MTLQEAWIRAADKALITSEVYSVIQSRSGQFRVRKGMTGSPSCKRVAQPTTLRHKLDNGINIYNLS